MKPPLLQKIGHSLRQGIRENRMLAVGIAVGWLVFGISKYPLAYLFSWDRDIWFIQLGTLLLILAESLALASLVCLGVAVVGASRPWRELRARFDGQVPAPTSRLLRSSVVRTIVGLGIVFLPLAVCLLSGVMHSSLWLDEISYWDYERSTALRSIEMGRPGSRIAPLFTNYFYCDIQRLFHAVVRPLGLTLQRDPELYLRLLSLVAFVAAVVFLYVRVQREFRSWWWTVAATLAFSAAPIFLFYAFEARVYEFSTLAAMSYLALFVAALRKPDSRRLWAIGALLGIVVVHLHVWAVCLLFSLFVVGVGRIILSRRFSEIPVVAWLTVPGGLVAALETGMIFFGPHQGGERFPLYLPRSFSFFRVKTLMGAFAPWATPIPRALRVSPQLPSLPELVLLIAAILAIVSLRRSPEVVFPSSAVLALLISMFIGVRFGYLISPRYQVPLFGALFFSLALVVSRPARLLIALLAALETALIPSVIADVNAKSNGKSIAEVIRQEAPPEGTAVVVQHGIRLGYPDPLHSFVLRFYLDEATAPPIRIFELPGLRDVTQREGLSAYFGGGPSLRSEYAAIAPVPWEAWLRSCPYDRLWIVLPDPAMSIEREQANAFARALSAAGFSFDRRHYYGFIGYPSTHLALATRPAHGPTR